MTKTKVYEENSCNRYHKIQLQIFLLIFYTVFNSWLIFVEWEKCSWTETNLVLVSICYVCIPLKILCKNCVIQYLWIRTWYWTFQIELIFYVLQWDVECALVSCENGEEFSESFYESIKHLFFYIDMHTLKQAPEQQHDTKKYIYLNS